MRLANFKTLLGVLCIYALTEVHINAQEKVSAPPILPVQYEELTAPDFVRAVARSEGVCIIPTGIIEKHGPQLPLGTDLLDIREIVLRAVKKEYCVVFPQFYFGQIYEAKHQPGAIAYSPDLVWKILQETCDELARNGFKKIIIANGHGGNDYLIPYFCQAQLANRKDYCVVLFTPESDTAVERQVHNLRKTTLEGGHADEMETSMMFAHRPDLIHPERGKEQSGEDLKRLGALPYFYTGIWWYAKYPNHYAGDGSSATREIGELLLNHQSNQLAKLITTMKQNGNTILELQQHFYDESEKPLKTKQ
jgi:creatinine amidohydrolase